MHTGRLIGIIKVKNSHRDHPPRVPSGLERFLGHHPQVGHCVHGFKVAFFEGMDKDGPTFRGLYGRSPYANRSRAVCDRNPSHIPPELDCSCGFYAVDRLSSPTLQGYRTGAEMVAAIYFRRTIGRPGRPAQEPEDPRTRLNRLLREKGIQRVLCSAGLPVYLEVALTGQVAVFEDGQHAIFRAQRQTILAYAPVSMSQDETLAFRSSLLENSGGRRLAIGERSRQGIRTEAQQAALDQEPDASGSALARNTTPQPVLGPWQTVELPVEAKWTECIASEWGPVAGTRETIGVPELVLA